MHWKPRKLKFAATCMNWDFYKTFHEWLFRKKSSYPRKRVIQGSSIGVKRLDSRLHGNDGIYEISTFYEFIMNRYVTEFTNRRFFWWAYYVPEKYYDSVPFSDQRDKAAVQQAFQAQTIDDPRKGTGRSAGCRSYLGWGEKASDPWPDEERSAGEYPEDTIMGSPVVGNVRRSVFLGKAGYGVCKRAGY